MRIHVKGPSPYEDTVGFSRAVRVGDVVYVSGTAPIGEDQTTCCPGDAYGQAMRCFEIIERALQEAGSCLEDVVRTRMYITNRASCGPVCKAHAEVFGEIKPAASMVVVTKLLEDDWLVEIEAEAVVGSGSAS
jgi:enamine deaminase RidA (YjgF/YER057c/UK114 family)